MKILPVTSLFSSSAHSIHSSLLLSICHDPRTHSLSGLSATDSEVGGPSGGSGGVVGLGDAHPLTTSRDSAKSVPTPVVRILGTVWLESAALQQVDVPAAHGVIPQHGVFIPGRDRVAVFAAR